MTAHPIVTCELVSAIQSAILEFKKRESRYKIRKKTSKEEEVKNEFFQFVVVVVIRRG